MFPGSSLKNEVDGVGEKASGHIILSGVRQSWRPL